MLFSIRQSLLRSIRASTPGFIGLLLLMLSYGSESTFACWDYCRGPGVGECSNICSVDFYPVATYYIEGCGYCDIWRCTYWTECLFGGGCNCECYSDLYREFCTG